MKKILLICILSLFAVVLTACVSGDKQASTEPKEEAKPAEQKEVSNAKPEETENGDIVFTEVGQKGDVEFGTLELLKIKNVNETIEIDPIKVTVNDIKLFKLTNITDDWKASLQQYNDNQAVGDSLIYVQVTYDSENTIDKNVGWTTLVNAVTDKGQQIEILNNDFIYTDSDESYDYLGKVKKEHSDGFLVKDEDISKIKFIWGSSHDVETYQDITPEQQTEYSF